MLGGARLSACFLMILVGVVALALAKDSPSADPTLPSGLAGPPKAKVVPVEDVVQGHKIVDSYRYLENSDDPDTKLYVERELNYTRAILDPLPGRDKINARLSQLLEIGTVGAPQMGGRYYFSTRRDGNQNQPILYVREGLNGNDRVLLDVNQFAADGTIALDWWYASEDGKYVAYGTSPSGSEVSTLRVIETATGKLLSDAIERTRQRRLETRQLRILLYALSEKGGRSRRPGTVPPARFLSRTRNRRSERPADFRPRPRPGVVAQRQPFRRRTLVADQRGAGLDEDRDISAGSHFAASSRQNHHGQGIHI